MAARRPDLYLIALLTLHGVIPEEVAESVISLYDGPPPMNLDSAMTTVHGTIRELIEAGAFGDGSDEDDDEISDKRLPMLAKQPGLVSGSSLPITPPSHVLAAFEWWSEVREFDARQHESDI